MSAPAKVSDEEIRRALKVWRGVVADARRALGISENALRKRLRSMGIGHEALSFFRSDNPPTQPQPTTTFAPLPMGTNQRDGLNLHPKNGGHNYPRPVDPPTLRDVSTEPITARRPQTKPPKLRPDQVDLLRDMKFDYQARHRTEADEGDLLQRFFDEAFPEWVKRALGAKAKA